MGLPSVPDIFFGFLQIGTAFCSKFVMSLPTQRISRHPKGQVHGSTFCEPRSATDCWRFRWLVGWPMQPLQLGQLPGGPKKSTLCAKRNALWFTVLCLVGVCDAATSVILHSCMFIQHFGEAVPFLISTRHNMLKRCESVCVFYRRYQVVYSPGRYGSQGA